jgi:hypothetical protein
MVEKLRSRMLAPVESSTLSTPPPPVKSAGFDEILVLPVDDLGRAIGERARLLPLRALGSDNGGAGAHGELGREQADSAADRVDENDVARHGHAHIMDETPRCEHLDGKGRRNIETRSVGPRSIRLLLPSGRPALRRPSMTRRALGFVGRVVACSTSFGGQKHDARPL